MVDSPTGSNGTGSTSFLGMVFLHRYHVLWMLSNKGLAQFPDQAIESVSQFDFHLFKNLSYQFICNCNAKCRVDLQELFLVLLVAAKG